MEKLYKPAQRTISRSRDAVFAIEVLVKLRLTTHAPVAILGSMDTPAGGLPFWIATGPGRCRTVVCTVTEMSVAVWLLVVVLPGTKVGKRRGDSMLLMLTGVQFRIAAARHASLSRLPLPESHGSTWNSFTCSCCFPSAVGTAAETLQCFSDPKTLNMPEHMAFYNISGDTQSCRHILRPSNSVEV